MKRRDCKEFSSDFTVGRQKMETIFLELHKWRIWTKPFKMLFNSRYTVVTLWQCEYLVLSITKFNIIRINYVGKPCDHSCDWEVLFFSSLAPIMRMAVRSVLKNVIFVLRPSLPRHPLYCERSMYSPAHDFVCEQHPAHFWVFVLALVHDGLQKQEFLTLPQNVCFSGRMSTAEVSINDSH
jgi:hypothetical protein